MDHDPWSFLQTVFTIDSAVEQNFSESQTIYPNCQPTTGAAKQQNFNNLLILRISPYWLFYFTTYEYWLITLQCCRKHCRQLLCVDNRQSCKAAEFVWTRHLLLHVLTVNWIYHYHGLLLTLKYCRICTSSLLSSDAAPNNWVWLAMKWCAGRWSVLKQSLTLVTDSVLCESW